MEYHHVGRKRRTGSSSSSTGTHKMPNKPTEHAKNIERKGWLKVVNR